MTRDERDALYDQLRSQVDVDIVNLTEVACTHPGLFHQVSDLIEEAKAEVEACNLALGRIRAIKTREMYADFSSFGILDAMMRTVADRKQAFADALDLDEEIIDARAELADAKFEVDKYVSLYEAFRHRKHMIMVVNSRDLDEVFSTRSLDGPREKPVQIGRAHV